MPGEEKKICPLTHHETIGAYDQPIMDFDFCVKENCAWWDDMIGACAILVIART